MKAHGSSTNVTDDDRHVLAHRQACLRRPEFLLRRLLKRDAAEMIERLRTEIARRR